VYILVTLAFLCALWLLLSGLFVPVQLALGAVSCLLVVWLGHRLRLLSGDARLPGLLLRLPRYGVWLGMEIIKSNLHVARLIVAREPAIARTVVRLETYGMSSLGVAIYANSITLTPGTLSMNTDDGAIEVHALTRGDAETLVGGEMQRRVARLEGRT